jgi:NAD(P)-dependent dehydrogenase (short-subunit alcohol dehydrogenase family)
MTEKPNIPLYPELENKSIVITGGGGILCGEMAKTLARQKANISILDLDEEKANAVADSIRKEGGKAIGISCNVLNKESIANARKRVTDEFGACDILINGAGGNHPKGTTSKTHFELDDLTGSEELTTFFDLDPKGIEFVFNLNFLGTLLPTQEFAKDMVKKADCSIINISSMNAFTPLTKIPAYSAAKAAVSNFTQWLAVHFSKVGLRVNALAPGFFLTDQNRTLLTTEDGSLTTRGNQIIPQTPMAKFGTPQDLDGALIWLCSNSSSFVTGVVIPIDGGFSAYSGV